MWHGPLDPCMQDGWSTWHMRCGSYGWSMAQRDNPHMDHITRTTCRGGVTMGLEDRCQSKPWSKWSLTSSCGPLSTIAPSDTWSDATFQKMVLVRTMEGPHAQRGGPDGPKISMSASSRRNGAGHVHVAHWPHRDHQMGALMKFFKSGPRRPPAASDGPFVTCKANTCNHSTCLEHVWYDLHGQDVQCSSKGQHMQSNQHS